MIDFRQQPPGFEQGIYNLSYEQYREIPALNSSRLKHLKKTPAHYLAAENAPEQSITPQLQRTFNRGTAFDIFILEGGIDVLKEKVAIEPDVRRNTNEYKAFKEKADAMKKLVMPFDDYATVVAMAEAAYKKSQFARLFESGVPHRVLIWQCPRTGLWCKAEIDWITSDGLVVDLKTTADCGFWFFSKNARRLGYVNQLAFYCWGLTVVTGILHSEAVDAAVEVEPPYESHVFVPSEEQFFYAHEQNEERIDTLLRCLETNKFPGYSDLMISLESGQYFDDDLTQWEDSNDRF